MDKKESGMSPFVSFLANKANKARAGFLHLYQAALDVVDKNVAQPALNARNEVTGVVSQAVTIGVDVAKNYKLVLIVVGLVMLAYLFGPLIRRTGEN